MKYLCIHILIFCTTTLFGSTWEGDLSSDWHNAGNWDTNLVPNLSDDVEIPGGTLNNPIIAANAQARSIDLKVGAKLILEKGDSLMISDLSQSFFRDTLVVNGVLYSNASPTIQFLNNAKVFIDTCGEIHSNNLWVAASAQNVDVINYGLVSCDDELRLSSSQTGRFYNYGVSKAYELVTAVPNVGPRLFYNYGLIEVEEAIEWRSKGDTLFNYGKIECFQISLDPGVLINSDSIRILGDSTSAGIRFNNQGILHNELNGIISVAGNNVGLFLLNNDTIFNSGLIRIKEQSTNAIQVRGSILNFPDGEFMLTDIPWSAIVFSPPAGDSTKNFFNWGKVTIGPGVPPSTKLIDFQTINECKFYNMPGGIFNGSGQIVNKHFASNGRIGPGNSIGTISFTESFQSGPSQIMDIEIDGASGPGIEEGHDQITSNFNIDLKGVLHVSVPEDYAPCPGDIFTIIQSGTSLTGSFELIDLPDIFPDANWVVYQDDTSFVLIIGDIPDTLFLEDTMVDGQQHAIHVVKAVDNVTIDGNASLRGGSYVEILKNFETLPGYSIEIFADPGELDPPVVFQRRNAGDVGMKVIRKAPVDSAKRGRVLLIRDE